MRTPDRAGFISLVIGIVVALAGVGIRSNGQPQLRLFDLTTAHGVVDKRPFRPTQVFAPQDNPIYVWFRGEGCTTGTTIRSLWYYLETDPPLRFTEGEVVVERPDDWGQFNFELAPGKQWPLGEYRIELRVGDALLAETRFRVEAPDTPRDTSPPVTSLRETLSREISVALHTLECDCDVRLWRLFQIALRGRQMEILDCPDECRAVARVLRVLQNDPSRIAREALQLAAVGFEADPVVRHNSLEDLLRVTELLAHDVAQGRPLTGPRG